jgi:hypothetical protein
MNSHPLRKLMFIVAVLLGFTATVSAAEPLKEDSDLCTRLFSAIESQDYDGFMVDADALFKSKLKPEQFEKTAGDIGPKLRAGYDLEYLGAYKQRGYRVTLWRLNFKDGGDDSLVTINLRNGKVGSFLIR